MDQGKAIQTVTNQKEEITPGAVSSCGSGQGVPHPGKTEVLKMFHIPGGKLLHPIMPQREGQPAIKNRVTPSARLSRIFPNFFHQITRIVDYHPVLVRPVLPADPDGFLPIEGSLNHRRVS